MRFLPFLFIITICFTSCKSSRIDKKRNTSTSQAIKSAKNTKADKIVKYAKQFKGVKYKWGGTTKSGMDCSGLVFESFRVHDIYLPRISRDIAKKGKKINLKEVQEGDLLFFNTKDRRHRINHVGLVTKSTSNTIEFIHATTSKGVIVSKFSESYWNTTFVEARRVL